MNIKRSFWSGYTCHHLLLRRGRDGVSDFAGPAAHIGAVLRRHGWDDHGMFGFGAATTPEDFAEIACENFRLANIGLLIKAYGALDEYMKAQIRRPAERERKEEEQNCQGPYRRSYLNSNNEWLDRDGRKSFIQLLNFAFVRHATYRPRVNFLIAGDVYRVMRNHLVHRQSETFPKCTDRRATTGWLDQLYSTLEQLPVPVDREAVDGVFWNILQTAEMLQREAKEGGERALPIEFFHAMRGFEHLEQIAMDIDEALFAGMRLNAEIQWPASRVRDAERVSA